MLRIQFNNGALLRINLPRANQKQAILELAQAFVAFEATLPEAERTPFTARLETAVTEAIAAQETAVDQEAARKVASEALKRTQYTAKRTLQKMRSLVQQRQSRNVARHSRLQENGRYSSLIEQLFNDVRLGLSYLVLVNFQGAPSRNLARWGFEIVGRTPRQPRDEMNGELLEEQEPLPEPA